MILYHLSENLCLQQRRKEERGCLQKERGGGLGRYLGWGNKVGTASWYCTCHSTASSPGEMAHAYHGSSSSPSQVMLAEEQICSKRGPPSLFFLRQGNSLQQCRLLAALGVASYWILLCVSEREAVAETIKLSSIWTKERIL